MRSIVPLILTLLLFPFLGNTQPPKSIHKAHRDYFESLGIHTTAGWDSLHGIEEKPVTTTKANCNLNKVVYGWHPYWMGSAYTNYQWDLLSHFSHFSFEVDPNTGYPSTTHGWMSSNAVTEAQNNGVKADLCVTLFNSHDLFLESATSRQNLIDTLINLVQARNANGVNIDFEQIPDSVSTQFNNFMVDLATQMHNQIPGSEVSMAIYSVEWGNIYNETLLKQYVDYFVIMGYGYHWSGSSVAGPTAPKYNFANGARNLSRSVNHYLNEGIPRSKLVLGLPYYGYEWETASSNVPENTTSSGSSRTYTTVRDNSNGYYSSSNEGWDNDSQTPYYVFYANGTWNQCFVDNAYSLDRRYNMINRRGLAGMGIWALGYDDGYSALWNEIRDNFTNCAKTPCIDTLYDMGGPADDYYNDENYTFTLDPDASGTVELEFTQFDVEFGYDTLWIYDGNSTSAPLIGEYTGTNGPGTVISTGETLTLRFESDGATTDPGWKAIWECRPDSVPPVTKVDTVKNWVTKDLTATFSDSDNTGGSGLNKAFYQVIHLNGNDWRANSSNGFFSDNFDQASLHSDWTVETGTWQLTNGYLHQSDQSNSNTNVHASLDQSLSNRYLYHWQGMMDGSGNNRRAGLHFFCDDPTQSNRGNSYFVYFRLDDNKIQLYEVVNNSWSPGPVKETDYNFQQGQWYDYKVTFDRITGSMMVYVNNELKVSWEDPSPLSSGSHISFRSGNCDYQVNNFKVYRSRFPSVTVSVGPGGTNDIRYQSKDPSSYAAKVKSIVQDSAGNLSSVDQEPLKVDWTPPSVPLVHDSLGQDVDTVINPNGALSANWTSSSDTNSGIQRYEYAIGTSIGDSNVVGWSQNMTDTSATETGLSLSDGQTYYFAIRALNGAGLTSDSVSDGQTTLLSVGIDDNTMNTSSVKAYPVPFDQSITLEWKGDHSPVKDLRLIDAQGRSIPLKLKYQDSGKAIIRMKEDLSKGIYFLILDHEKTEDDRTLQLIHE